MTQQSSIQAFKTSITDANKSMIASVEFFDELATEKDTASSVSQAIVDITAGKTTPIGYIDLGLTPYVHHQNGSNVLSLRFRDADKGGTTRTLAKITFEDGKVFSKAQRIQLAQTFRNPQAQTPQVKNTVTSTPNNNIL